MSQVWRAFAKVNLDLRILGKRSDGYHEIRTRFQTIDLHDVIRVSAQDSFRFTASEGPEDESNLVVRAVRAFEDATSIDVRLHLDLEKRVPSAAGLGGGSADAAVTLLGLIRWYGADIPGDRVHHLLSGLGSDVPFFAVGGHVLAIGRGETLFPLPDANGVDSSSWLVLVTPPINVNSADAYYWLTEIPESNTILGFCAAFAPRLGGVKPAPSARLNDFEVPVFRRFPELAEIKGALVSQGARQASLSGSGATLFGEFSAEVDAARAVHLLQKDYDVTLVRSVSRADYLRRVFDE
jgi:4-diphosphocytidyl-2-C-methyl-D-erythritol kinase